MRWIFASVEVADCKILAFGIEGSKALVGGKR